MTTTLIVSLVKQVHLTLPNLATQLTSTHLDWSSSLVPLLAVSTVEPSINAFLDFIQKLLIVPALALSVYAAFQISESRVRESLMGLGGALLLALAVPIVRAIFSF